MLAEDNVREGFVDADDFKKVLSHLPEQLRPLIVFPYTTGCRLGAALDITWDMVSPDAKTMTLPGRITKNDKAIVLPLPGELTSVLKKQFRKEGRVFDASNLRKQWEKATLAAGFADLLIHDLRRSGVRNLITAVYLRQSP
jgi:integrase